MHVIVGVLVGCALLYAGMNVLVATAQSRYVYVPSRTVAMTPAALGLSYESVKLRVGGSEIHGWYVPCDGAASEKTGRATVLFCHGNAGNIGDRLGAIQALHHLGFGVLIFDYQGYGQSEGAPTEQGTYADAMVAWKYLVEERGMSPDRIVIFGRSLGGAVACELATHVTARALVLESTFTSASDMARMMFPLLATGRFCRFGYDTKERIGKLDCPVIIAHSPKDEMIPYRHGRALYDAAHAPKRLVELAGGHNQGGFEENARYQTLVQHVARTGAIPEEAN